MTQDLRFKSILEEMDKAREEKGVDINGAKYAKVRDRIEVFRRQFGAEYGINTDVQFLNNDTSKGAVVVGKATILDSKTGVIVGSGHAMNFFMSDEVNTTSVIEVTETNAIGRALASFGLMGGEYASENEMAALPAKKEAATRYVKQGTHNPPQSDKERKFREAVDKSFPPSVNQYKFTVPTVEDPEAENIVYGEIEKINDGDTLTAYYKALEHLISWVPPEVAQEIKASFAARNKQLKGK
jgi:hypothetical protein